MRRRDWELIGIFLFIIWSGSVVYGQDAAEYIILQDIGQYQFITETSDFITGEPKTIPGYIKFKGPGLIAAAGHFYEDHQDITFETNYVKLGVMSVSVQVTRHAGVDSDQWLLHEVEMDFRENYGTPGDCYVMRQIDGNTIMADGIGGWFYRWVSNNTVINIQYNDSQMTKPEPLEVVRAYLAKYPSTLSLMTSADLREDANRAKWIKDEMGRLLWLCDRWFIWQSGGNISIGDALEKVVKYLSYFLDYRQKCYSISSDEAKTELEAALRSGDNTLISARLNDYKQWWEGHKGDTITLP